MAKPKYTLEELRKKCGGYGKIGLGARQLEFIFAAYDEQKARADKAEAERDWLVDYLEKQGDCPFSALGETKPYAFCKGCCEEEQGSSTGEPCWLLIAHPQGKGGAA